MDSYIATALDFWDVKSLDQLKGRKLFKDVLLEDFEYLAIEFATMVLKLGEECNDNFRIKPERMYNEFLDIAAKGCCGSFDSYMTAPSGNVYCVGFNYGH